MAEDLTELQTKHSNMLAKLEEYKRKHLELGHSLLQVKFSLRDIYNFNFFFR